MTLLAQTFRELCGNGRIDRVDEAAATARETHNSGVVVWSERHERPAAHTREHVRRARVRDEAGADQCGRQGLARLPRRDEARHLLVREEVLGDERSGERALDRGQLRRLRLRAVVRDLAEDAEGLLGRGVLRDVRDRSDGDRKVADPRVEREEDDRSVGQKRLELAGDL